MPVIPLIWKITLLWFSTGIKYQKPPLRFLLISFGTSEVVEISFTSLNNCKRSILILIWYIINISSKWSSKIKKEKRNESHFLLFQFFFQHSLLLIFWVIIQHFILNYNKLNFVYFLPFVIVIRWIVIYFDGIPTLTQVQVEIEAEGRAISSWSVSFYVFNRWLWLMFLSVLLLISIVIY